MRREEFDEGFPGDLVPLADGWSFIPAPLPPAVKPSWAIHRADERARGALGEFIGRARSLQNDILVIRPLQTREAVESNKIENTITKAADILLQEAGESPTDPERAKDNLEVIRYRTTLSLGASEVERGRGLTLHLLQSLHEQLLRGTRGEHRSPGAFRRENVLIGRERDTFKTARFVPPPWEQVRSLMEAFAEFVGRDPEYSPLISASLAHYQIEAIHPFLDGNGRLGRLLIPMYLLSKRVLDRPIIYLSAYFEANRDEYIERLKSVSTRGDWESWILFFLGAVEDQAIDSLSRVGLVTSLHEKYRELARTQGRTKATLPAIDLLMEAVIVTAQEVSDYARCSYNTGKAAIEDLARLGIVSPLAKSWPQRWWAKELVDRVYQS